MDYSTILLLLSMGFVVGLSGAIMPGPLLIYTINQSLVKGKWVGAQVILGHALVEVGVFLLLLFGLLEFLASEEAVKAIALLGGIALILMAVSSLMGLKSRPQPTLDRIAREKTKYGVVASGMIFSAFNPGFPTWWATAGSSLLMAGFKELGTFGMVIVLVGHWGADLGWFLLVSMTTSKSADYIFEKGWYRNIRIMLAAILLVIGVYFLSTIV